MYIITYSLRESEIKSNRYYNDISLFTDEVLVEIKNLTHNIVKNYISFLDSKSHDKPCKKEEYGLELLILGVLWRVYGGDSTGLDEMPAQLMTGLASFRKRGGTLKPGIDFVKGIMSTLFLSPDLYDNMFVPESTPLHMEKLLNWLSATGEFNYEVKRLNKWYQYLTSLPSKDASDIIATSITLASWFEVRSEEVIGKYTANVDRYLNEIRPGHYWHEDVIFCGRRRVEYHLNMVGAEIMNRVFRNDFIKTTKKVVVLPACMRLLQSSKCRAKVSGKNLFCSRCTKECIVNKINKLGKERGFDVVMVSHESSISSSSDSNTFLSEDTGIVGIACVLNLISGGLMLRDMGISPQCVLLDYCGCKNHWSKEGLPTEINLDQLKKVLLL